MRARAQRPPALGARAQGPSLVSVGIAAFAAVELGLALFMALAPHAFYAEGIGGFDSYNPHYIRDVASFEGAIGIALVLALRRSSWRVPVLALTTMQFTLHSLNHLIDIGNAHPVWTGYLDFFSLAGASVLLGWLWRQAALEARP